MRYFDVELTAREFAGNVSTVHLTTDLDVPENATSAQVVRAFWRQLSESGNNQLDSLPDWDTVLGFDLKKISARNSGEYRAVERSEMETEHAEPRQFRVFADAVMHDGDERSQPMGNYTTNTATDAKRQAWEKLKTGGFDWCSTAALTESVTFRVMMRDQTERVYFDAEKLESNAEESEGD